MIGHVRQCDQWVFFAKVAIGKIVAQNNVIPAVRIEERYNTSITPNIVHKRSFSVRDFKTEYNSFKGNAYGLANTLMQTAILKPKIKSKKISNLYFTGQLTVPGPGVPPAIISGEVVAKYILKSSKN